MNFDQYIEEAKEFLLKQSVEQVFDLITSKIAFLAWGPLAPLFKLLLKIIIRTAIYETEIATFFKYTDVRVNAQGRAFYEAIEENFNAKKGNDEEVKKHAEKNLINTFRDLVKLNN